MPNPNTFASIRTPIVDKSGNPNHAFLKQLQTWNTQLNGTINQLGQVTATLTGLIAASAKIQGRTEGIGTTVGQLTSAGQLASTDQIAADGTGSPLTGGKRGFLGLDVNSRLASSFKSTGVNVSSTPTAATVLSNNGIATAITIAGSTNQFAPSTVSYNSGSIDPGSFTGPVFVYAADPTFAGGAVPYSFSTTPQQQTAAEGNVLFGTITTTNGTSKTGGGNTGGTGGSPGGRGFNHQ